jgi:hypothetical protein
VSGTPASSRFFVKPQGGRTMTEFEERSIRLQKLILDKMDSMHFTLVIVAVFVFFDFSARAPEWWQLDVSDAVDRFFRFVLAVAIGWSLHRSYKRQKPSDDV